MDQKQNKVSVESPSNSIEGVNKNCGGLPPTMDVKEIFAANTPPKTPAKNSTEGLGEQSK